MICNACFIGGLVLRFVSLDIPLNNTLIRTILVIGFLIAIPANLLVLLLTMILAINVKTRPKLPWWLIACNMALFSMELGYWLYRARYRG